MKEASAVRDLIAKSISLAVVFLVTGCAAADYGGIHLSANVNKLFESHQVLEDHNYYYSGSDTRPRAILGVDKKYRLRSNLWKPVNLTPGILKQWIDLMTDYRGFSIRTYGAEVTGPGGEPIGVWYSPWSWTTVKMEEDNQVVIYTPTSESPGFRGGVIFGREKDR